MFTLCVRQEDASVPQAAREKIEVSFDACVWSRLLFDIPEARTAATKLQPSPEGLNFRAKT
jgi:hypothetical protein